MLEKESPLFGLFEQQFCQAKVSFMALGKNLKSKQALKLKDKLIFLNIYLTILSKIHFKEEKLKYQVFDPFKTICRGLKRIYHYKMICHTFALEKSKASLEYNSYQKYLVVEKKDVYREVYDDLISSSPDIWKTLCMEAAHYSKKIEPLMINIATTQLINEEIKYCQFTGENYLESQTVQEILEGLRIVTAVENIKIAIGLNPLFTSIIHGEMKALSQLLNKWHQYHLFAQHLNAFLSEKAQAGTKYLDLAKTIKSNKQRLNQEVASQCGYLFKKLLP